MKTDNLYIIVVDLEKNNIDRYIKIYSCKLLDKMQYDIAGLETEIDNFIENKPHYKDVILGYFEPEGYEVIRNYISTNNKKDIKKYIICNLNKQSNQKMDVLVCLDDKDLIIMQNFIQISNTHLDKGYFLFCKIPPLCIDKNCSKIFISPNVVKDIIFHLDEIYLCNETRIIFMNTDDSMYKYIDRDFWKFLFSSYLPSVYTVNIGGITKCKLFDIAKEDITTLFIFPERMLPSKRAYFVRGFDLILNLNYNGIPTGCLFLGPNNKDLDKIRESLSIISPYVAGAVLKRGKANFYQKLRNKIEKIIRNKCGINYSPPIRFSERCTIFCTKENYQFLLKELSNFVNIKCVIYTGAWFTPVIKNLKKLIKNVKWFCDTHDVFFKLDYYANINEVRFFYCPKKEKKKEISMLNSIDGIINISDSDKNDLLEENIVPKTIVASGSFEYCTYRIIDSKNNDTWKLGFIGSNNANNERSINILKESWLPNIIKCKSNIKLYIAGGICNANLTKELLDLYKDNIELLGFVSNLRNFYENINVVIAPITVQGGLNFKSVEALMSGCPLITNKLGARCLNKKLKGIYIIEDPLVDFKKIFQGIENLCWKYESQQIRNIAMKYYGNDSAYKELIYYISSCKSSNNI